MCAVLIAGGACIAIVGFIDDLRGVPAPIRLAVHIAAAFGALLASGPPSPQWWTAGDNYGWIEFLTMAVGIVWSINLFNFMDGIDGLAGAESAFIGAASALLLICMVSATSSSGAGAAVFAVATLGYLWWNWPPARIFMGDVGSGYVGYVIAVLALNAQREHAGSLLVWSILSGLFVVDATITLLRRLARGERVFQAHRRHAYQILARRWNSHARVTVVALIVNLLWLLPLAALAVWRPEQGLIWLLLAMTPLCIAVLRIGAGGPAEH
ncbi:MAG: glycosyltransferase family 4 protein [Pseudomonadota bacterium]|nr:glycosyltransferase family 4 protein [Pseudomonadota bacterium]